MTIVESLFLVWILITIGVYAIATRAKRARPELFERPTPEVAAASMWHERLQTYEKWLDEMNIKAATGFRLPRRVRRAFRGRKHYRLH